MFYEVTQSDWFLPILGISLLGYYAWVFLTYFRSGIAKGFKSVSRGSSKHKFQLTCDELTMGFALHRRLIADPNSPLDIEEKALLGRSPFKELIQQTTMHYNQQN
jgi:hypothetical protein